MFSGAHRAVLAVAVPITIAAALADEGAAHFTAKGAYDDVKDSVVAAIEARGLLVDRVAHVGEMLDRTAKDLGASRRVYEKAEVIEFCSARVSRGMMEVDPRNLVYCPYTIAVYTLPGERGVVHLSYRRPPEAPGMRPVAELLDAIAKEATR